MTGPLAGEPRERRRDLPAARRVGSWLVWWVLMMSFWVMLDDSVSTDELLAGAGAAALAALLAELVTYQAATRFRMRIEWLVPALRLPGEVARDTVTVYRALWRRLAHGEQPPSAFLELPARTAMTAPGGYPPGSSRGGDQPRSQHVRARHRQGPRRHGGAPAGRRGKGVMTW